MEATVPSADEVLQQLERILGSHRFAAAERSSRFLRFVVEKAVAGASGEIKEVVIASEIYGRAADYDPKTDSVVRVEASRLRTKLKDYYAAEGALDPVRITIPKGAYIPQFERIAQSMSPAGAPPPAKSLRSAWALGAAVCGVSVLLWLSIGRTARVPATPLPEAVSAAAEGEALLALDPHSGESGRGIPSTLERAINRFEYAVARDPKYARAWAWLAEAYDYAAVYVGRDAAEDTRRAEAAARRAIALDERLAAGHAMLALIRFCLHWDFAGAEREYLRAIELDPQNPYAAVEYADLLRETGRIREADEVIRRTRALMPELPVLAVKEAEILIDRGQFDAARAAAESALRMKSTYGRARVALGLAWELEGEHERAVKEYRIALDINPRDRRALPALGHALGVSGRRDEALAIARQLEDLNSRVRNCAFQVAMVYIGMGDEGLALEWLERAHATRQVHVPFMAVEPRFRSIRGEARFQAIVRQVLPGSTFNEVKESGGARSSGIPRIQPLTPVSSRAWWRGGRPL
jgi:tetratricopeptide (TPR) repeat protein